MFIKNTKKFILAVLMISSVASLGVFEARGQTGAIPSDTVIVFLGDSIGAGVGATSGNGVLQQLERNIGVPIVNESVSGDTTAGALSRLQGDVINRNPDIVIIFLGGNDILSGVSQTQMFNNLRSIITNVQDAGAKVVLVGIHGAIFSVDFETGFKNLATERGVAYVPNAMSGIAGNTNLTVDLIHPNDAGHALLASRIAPAVRTAASAATPGTPASQQPERKDFTALCSVIATYNGREHFLQWNSRVQGAATTTTYQWTGSDGLSSNSALTSKLYSTSGLKTGNVTIAVAGETANLSCSADLPTGSASTTSGTRMVGGRCVPQVNGMTVTWDGQASGNTASTTYIWTGSDGLSATATSVPFIRKTYTTEGVKEGRVTINSGGQTISLGCQAKVASTTTSGCFIATAAFGTEMEPEVETLRNFRDEKLLTNSTGRTFVDTYYKYSPPVADFIREKDSLKAVVRMGLRPAVIFLELWK